MPFALGGRLVHFNSKCDMPALGLLHLFTLPPELNKNLPIDQEPAQNSFKASKFVCNQLILREPKNILSAKIFYASKITLKDP